DLKPVQGSRLIHLDFSRDQACLGGSSFAQMMNKIGNEPPTVKDSGYFVKAFNAVQQLIEEGEILAGHDISSGGTITALLEMAFPTVSSGLAVHMEHFPESDPIKALFSENPGVLLQIKNIKSVSKILDQSGLDYFHIADVTQDQTLTLKGLDLALNIAEYRDIWFRSSYLLDQKQSGEKLATDRFNYYKHQPLYFRFHKEWQGNYDAFSLDPFRKKPSNIKAAIIREKGVKGDREMAYGLWLAGFDVKDVHMTDLVSGKENLQDVKMIVFVGGFSNSDVLGSAKG